MASNSYMRKTIFISALTVTVAGLIVIGARASQEVKVDEQDNKQDVIRADVNEVVAPTIVMDKRGNIINGLTLQDFIVYDNDKRQDFKLDVTFQPIDVVVVIQANGVTDEVLPRIKKMGPLLEGLVVGEQGSVAVIAFDHRIRVMQDFTADGTKIKKALESINAGSSSSRQIDALTTGVRMLSHRPKERRRVLMLISETRDNGSEGRLRDTLLLTEINNVLVYTLNMSRFVNTLTAKTPVPRPSAIPPSAIHTPAGGQATPNTQRQNRDVGNVMPAFWEIIRDVKSVFVSNPAEVMTKFTGGREFGFISQKALEESITKIGEELHSHYLVSYNPNNKLEGGWHAIRIEVRRPAGSVEVRTRPGYWMAAKPN